MLRSLLCTTLVTVGLAFAPTLTWSAVPEPPPTADELGLMQGFPPPPEQRVDRSSLISGPGNRWAYQNMRSLYPTAGVEHASTPIPIRKHMDGAIERLVIKHPEGGDVSVDTWLRESYTDALVVIDGDTIVFERFLNGMHSDQPHQMMSVTKSFAGLFGLMAVEAGLADEDERVSTYLPELEASGAFGKATFGEVLDMTNSMDFSEDYADPESGIVHYAIVLGLMPPVEGRSYASSIYDYLPSLEGDPEHRHGDVFHYQTPKTDVVNWVTNRVSGASFQDNMEHYLWSRLGTDGETYVLLDKNGTLFAGGGLNATPYDLSRFAIMMLQDGIFNGAQVVAPEIIADLAEGGSRKAFSKGPNASGYMGDGDWSYRAQWWVRHTPGREAF
ncbi:MAG: serine hydrolase, partial [Pseudomonadota bacterium]